MDDPSDPNNAPTRPMRSLRDFGARARALPERRAPLLILIALVLILVVAAALWPVLAYTQQPHPTYATARLGDVILSAQVTGRVEATAYQADFAVSGALSEIDVTPGQRVNAGDTLAKLNAAPFQSALTDAQSIESAALQSLNAATTAQSRAQSAVSSAWSTLSAQQSYAQSQCAVQPSDPDACNAAKATVVAAQTQLATAQAQLTAAQARVAAARKEMNTAREQTAAAKAQLAAATLTAPHAGIVATINGVVGGKPGATASGLASFITIIDTGQPLVTALVSYHEINVVRAGEPATIRVAQASASTVFTGEVTGVSLQEQGSGDALSYPVSLRIDPGSLGGVTLLPGMTAATRIITRARYHVTTIPASAINYARTAAPGSGEGVLTRSQITAARAQAHTLAEGVVASGFDVADDPLTPTYLIGFKDNHYIAIPVVLGLTDGKQWEVVAGLTAGQRVVNGQQGTLFG